MDGGNLEGPSKAQERGSATDFVSDSCRELLFASMDEWSGGDWCLGRSALIEISPQNQGEKCCGEAIPGLRSRSLVLVCALVRRMLLHWPGNPEQPQ